MLPQPCSAHLSLLKTPSGALLLAVDPADDGQEQGAEREAVSQHTARISALPVTSGRGLSLEQYAQNELVNGPRVAQTGSPAGIPWG